MSGSLAGKTALVCNASSSMGYAIARRLGVAGAHVFLSDTDETGLKFSVDGLRGAEVHASSFVADLSNAEQRRNLIERMSTEVGRLDVAVYCNKPNQIKGDIMQSTSDHLEQMFSKYVTTPFFMCKDVLPLLEKSSSSSIILISSIAGYTPFIDIGMFSAVQTGVLGLCKAMAQSLAKRHIRVNSVCLGMFDDDGSGAAWSSCSGVATEPSMTNEQADAIRKGLASWIPLGRTGRGKDCAGLVEFLASDRSSYITGENFPISGGVSVRI